MAAAGQDIVLSLEEQLNTIKLPLMALKLDELYRSPDYTTMDKLDFLSVLIAPEVKDKVTKPDKKAFELPLAYP